MERITVARLAKELDTDLNRVMQLAGRAGVRVTRGAATLSPKQAERVRARAKDEANRAAKAALRPRPGAPAATAETRQPAPARDVESRVGPPNPCACCGLNLGGHRSDDDEPARLCAQCLGHHDTGKEDATRVLLRLRDHDQRLRLVYAQMWSQMTELHERVRAALHSRNAWRRALVQVALAHEQTPVGCACGVKTYPCVTIKTIDAVNRGIARQVEDFLALDDDARDAALGHDDGWRTE